VIGGSGEASGDLSGGQKRRLAIARALAVNPDLFIADEPTADLDPKAASEILELLHSLSRAGAIVIAVLHAPDQRIVGAKEIMVVEQ
jgi:ABC-type multidrug transport system ATPase subunit